MVEVSGSMSPRVKPTKRPLPSSECLQSKTTKIAKRHDVEALQKLHQAELAAKDAEIAELRRKLAAKQSPKVQAKPKAKAAAPESSDDSSSDDEPAPKAKAVAKPKAKAVAPKEDDSSDYSGDEEEPAPKAKASPKVTPAEAAKAAKPARAVDLCEYRVKNHIRAVEGADGTIGELPDPFTSFEATPFAPDVVKMLAGRFSAPSPIQAQAWPLVLAGTSMIGIAQTGSGKTLAFLLPVLHLAGQGKGPKILVLAPTRELATQIDEQAKPFAPRSVCLYGGVPKGPQAQACRKDPLLIVATPGRLLDHAEDKAVQLGGCEYLVLDEADRMLDMGFAPALEKVFGLVSAQRQVLFFTATWSKATSKLAKAYLQDAVALRIGQSEELAANRSVTQTFHQLSDLEKDEQLWRLLNDLGKDDRAMVFANTKRRCEMLVKAVWSSGYGAVSIHGDKEQWEREKALQAFEKGEAPVLFCTDVAARGLDIKLVTHVVNYDMPADVENYVHRIGRTGRAGKTGNSITFVNRDYDLVTSPALVRIAEEALQPVPAWLKKYEEKELAARAQPGYKKKSKW